MLGVKKKILILYHSPFYNKLIVQLLVIYL